MLNRGLTDCVQTSRGIVGSIGPCQKIGRRGSGKVDDIPKLPMLDRGTKGVWGGGTKDQFWFTKISDNLGASMSVLVLCVGEWSDNGHRCLEWVGPEK